MATATEDYLTEVRRRIARLEVQAQRDTADAKSRMQPYINTVRRDEESARATARKQAAARTGVAREQAEAAIADLRQHHVSISTSFPDVGTAANEGWCHAQTRVLAELDALESQADAYRWPTLGRGGTTRRKGRR